MAVTMNVNKNEIKKKMDKLAERFEQSSSGGQNYWDDPNELKMEIGNTYQVRMIDVSYDDKTYPGPFIEKHIHVIPMSDDENAKKIPVICSRTDVSSEWWKYCEICQFCYDLYNKNENRYRTLKSKFHGWVPVYVVNDPTNSENNGHVKLLHYTWAMRKFFLRNIFNSWKDLPEDDVIGDDAFNFPEGFNLNVVVSKNESGYRDYELSFSSRMKKIEVDTGQLQEELEQINPESYIQHYDPDKITKVHRRYILGYDDNGESTQAEQSDNGTTESSSNETESENSSKSENSGKKSVDKDDDDDNGKSNEQEETSSDGNSKSSDDGSEGNKSKNEDDDEDLQEIMEELEGEN